LGGLLFLLILLWLVDPGCFGQVDDLRAGGGAEPFGMGLAGRGQGCLTFGMLGGGEAVVNVGRGVQPDPGVAVMMVISVDEGVHELPG